ncbi:MAG: hypothetical protein ACR2P2_06055 [Nakamurella sp.]
MGSATQGDWDSSRLVAFTGLPGTGKSMLSDLIGKWLGAPAFAGDWLLGALKPAAKALAQLDRAAVLELYESLLRSLITRAADHRAVGAGRLSDHRRDREGVARRRRAVRRFAVRC